MYAEYAEYEFGNIILDIVGNSNNNAAANNINNKINMQLINMWMLQIRMMLIVVVSSFHSVMQTHLRQTIAIISSEPTFA